MVESTPATRQSPSDSGAIEVDQGIMKSQIREHDRRLTGVELDIKEIKDGQTQILLKVGEMYSEMKTSNQWGGIISKALTGFLALSLVVIIGLISFIVSQ